MPKNILLCFDGTNNHPKDAEQEREWFGRNKIEDSGITNVLKLHLIFGGDLDNKSGSATQHSFYYPGVGTYGSKFRQVFNATLAPENLDVGRIILNAASDLKSVYQPGDKIFIFGFSRGAAIARKFASVIGKHIDCIKNPRPVRFLGVFDTVASIGVPNLDKHDMPRSDVVFEDQFISPHIQEALHLVAIDENRVAFQPTLMNAETRVTEVWFPGAHSDVGGGFWYDGLSDTTLQFMLEHIKRKALGVTLHKPADINFANLIAAGGKYHIDFDDVRILPDILGKSHPKDRWGPIAGLTLSPRKICVLDAGKPSATGTPLVYVGTGTRIEKIAEYRPQALKDVQHHQITMAGDLLKNPAGQVKKFEGIRDFEAANEYTP